ETGVPVITTRFFNREGSPYVRWIRWAEMMGPPDTDLHPAVASLAQVVFDKLGYTCFTPEVTAWLKDKNVTRLIGCGIATEACGLNPAVSAFEREIEPVVVADACASHAGSEDHEAGLRILSRLIGEGQIRTLRDVVSELKQTAAASTA